MEYVDGVRSRHEEKLKGVRESSTVLRGNVVSDSEANVRTPQRFAAQEELWRQGLQGSVDRPEDVCCHSN